MTHEQLRNMAIAGAVGGTIAIVTTTALQVAPRPSSDAVDRQLSAVRDELRDVMNAAQSVQQRVRTLSGEELTERLTALSGKTDSLEKQLGALQQIISPKNASEILTVARMKDEILARETFEKRVNGSTDETRKKVDAIQNWLLALFSTMVAALLGFAVLLLRRTSLLYTTVQALEAELKANKEPNHGVQRTPASGRR